MEKLDRRQFFRRMVTSAATLVGTVALTGVAKMAYGAKREFPAMPRKSPKLSEDLNEPLGAPAEMNLPTPPEPEKVLVAGSVRRSSRRTARRTARRVSALDDD